MTPASSTLTDRHADRTRRALLDSAVSLLENGPVVEMTARAVARAAGASERTVFRYFATRDELLDAVARAVIARLAAPPPPTTLEELLRFPATLFARFEANPGLTQAALQSELFPRIRSAVSTPRWAAIQKLLVRVVPAAPRSRRRLAAAHFRYILSATTWNYYRFFLGFGAEETVAAVEQALRDALDGLKRAR